jgi:hypothetical protein
LTSLDLPNWDSLAVNAFNFNLCEAAVIIRAKQEQLSDLYLTFQDHARQNMTTIFFKGLRNMKFWTIVLILLPLVRARIYR